MKPIIYSIFNHERLAKIIQKPMDADLGKLIMREFPDGETYMQVMDKVKDRLIILIDSLERPNPKIGPLLFFTETLRQEGAKQIGLVAPYLCYMRQDKQFKKGEGVTSAHFAKFISSHFDWLVTVDPHLHRYKAMDEVYTIPTQVIHAASNISKWIDAHVQTPILIGPDSESEQWVANVANEANIPYTILEKIRHGDRDVEISIPNRSLLRGKNPILVDDIISTGTTMKKTIAHLKEMHAKEPVCIGIHGLFAQNAYNELLEAGAQKIVTCNTIQNQSNEIDVSASILAAIKIFTDS